MSAAADTLPDLSATYLVPQAKIDYYRHNGHVVLRNICTREELDYIYPSLASSVDRFKKEKLKLEDRDTYHKAFIQVTNLWRLDETVKRFVTAQRFARIAADLMGVRGVRIYHDQALFKEPGGGHTPWHQDQYYWPIEGNNAITLWMPFVTAPIEKGTMSFAGGLQKGPLVQLGISDASSDWYSAYMREHDIPLTTYELSAGDATFHGGWTPHKAAGNSTKDMRPVMTVIYVDADAKVCEPMNEHQPVDMAAFFPGLKPGDSINTHLNPVAWEQSANGAH